MSALPPNNPNMPNKPTKPPDFSSSVTGQPSSAMPNPNTGPTPQKSALTMHINAQSAGTLVSDPIAAAAPPNDGMVVGQCPSILPHIDVQSEGLEACQNLEPAFLPLGQSRATMPEPSGPFVLADSPPIVDMPYSAPLSSSQLKIPTS
ncbi:hypothetical protein Adt_36405 [Abeliophyllum distichum]|uniref:Uncharacterized protein n=1 Tax=Abeliophyllum distichum TaxID=126358 RepID=A0ABD1QHF4_9LAMI